MKPAMIRKALLPVLAASAVMVSTPALAQNFSVSLSFGSPGYSHGYGYAPRDLHYRARALSQHIDRLAQRAARSNQCLEGVSRNLGSGRQHSQHQVVRASSAVLRALYMYRFQGGSMPSVVGRAPTVKRRSLPSRSGRCA